VRKATFEGISELINGLSFTNLKNFESDLVLLLLLALNDENEEIVAKG